MTYSETKAREAIIKLINDLHFDLPFKTKFKNLNYKDTLLLAMILNTLPSGCFRDFKPFPIFKSIRLNTLKAEIAKSPFFNYGKHKIQNSTVQHLINYAIAVVVKKFNPDQLYDTISLIDQPEDMVNDLFNVNGDAKLETDDSTIVEEIENQINEASEQIENIEALFFREPKDFDSFIQCYNQAIKSNFKDGTDSFTRQDVVHFEEDPKNIIKQQNGVKDVINQSYYQVRSLDHLKQIIRDFVNDRALPFKLNFTPYFIYEDSFENGDVAYEEFHFDHRADLSKTKDLLVTSVKSIEPAYEYIMQKIYDESNMDYSREHNYPGKGICCFAISLVSYNMGDTGARNMELIKYETGKFKRCQLRPCNEDDNLCLFRALAWFRHDCSIIKIKNSNDVNREAKLLFKSFYGEEADPKKYKGFRWLIEIERFCHHFKVDINKYIYDVDTHVFKAITPECTTFDKQYPRMNLISHTFADGTEHVMSIKDIERLSKLKFCSKCGVRSFKTVEGLKKHEETCDSSPHSKMLKVQSIPYVPIFYNNKLYTFCKAHGLKYTPMKYYACYDFETYEQSKEQCKNSSETIEPDDSTFTSLVKPSKSTIMAYLTEFSVALGWNTPDGKIETDYFCMYELKNNTLIKNPYFVEHFIQRCIEIGSKLKQYNKDEFLKHIPPEYHSNQLFIQYLDQWSSKVSVLGFNSEKFDTNFLRKHLNNIPTDDIYLIGDVASIKQLGIKTKFGTTILFRDALNYISKCSLDEASKSYGGSKEGLKGFFPYSLLNESTLESVLLNTQILPQDAFFNDLKQEPMTDDDYEIYKSDFKQYPNFYSYTKFYNVQDVKIMFPIVDNLITKYSSDGEDMLCNISLSGLASSIKYLKCYDDFDVNANYKQSNEKTSEKRYYLTLKAWTNMVTRYKDQDEYANRPTKNNVTKDDFEYFKKLIDNGCCWCCKDKFTWLNKPTLDRIDNSKGHSKNNLRLACKYCNCYCSDCDAEMQRFYIQLKRYADLNHLTYSIEDPDVIKILFDAVTGGLSNVHHRINESNKNYITKLFYHEDTHSVEVIETMNKITHFIGIDKNSLYPSSFSGAYHDFNPYTGGRMYMPGKVTSFSTNMTPNQKKRAMAIILNPKRKSKDQADIDSIELFVAEVKGYIPPDKINKCINFLPIFRNMDVPLSPEVIGEYMTDYMETNNIKYRTPNYEKWEECVLEIRRRARNDEPIGDCKQRLDEITKNPIYKTKRTLTQTYSTIQWNDQLELDKNGSLCSSGDKYVDEVKNGYVKSGKNDGKNGCKNSNTSKSQYMAFSTYYLWYLIDEFGFVVEDVKSIITFDKHLKFGNFVGKCMSARQEAISKKKEDKSYDVLDKYYKNILNSSYGFDGKRCDNYNKSRIVTAKDAFKSHRSPLHLNTIELGNDRYITVERTKNFKIQTPVQCAVFTLDNAKFWYLTFIYNFMMRCLDMTRLHYAEGDTDSQYWAVSGECNEDGSVDYTQAFKHVILDEEFYNENVHKWLPYNFYTTDGRTAVPDNASNLEKIAHEKKLLGCAIEKQGLNIVALGPKCYTTWNNENNYKCKVKGVRLSTNKHITFKSYIEVIQKETTIDGTNYLLQYKKIIPPLNSKQDNKNVDKSNENSEGGNPKIEIDRKQKLINRKAALEQNIARLVKEKMETSPTYFSMIHEARQIKELIKTDNCSEYVETEVYKYAKIKLNKTALTGVHVKMKVINDQCQTCVPLFFNEYIPELTPIQSEWNSRSHTYQKYRSLYSDEYEDVPYSIPEWFGSFFLSNPNPKSRKLNPVGIPDYVHPLFDYLKNPGYTNADLNKWWVKSYNGYTANKYITGICIDVNKSPFCIIDFDIEAPPGSPEPSKDKERIRNYIIKKYKLKTGLVQTTSGGLHYYTIGADDSTFEQYTRVSRFTSQNTGAIEYDKNGNVMYKIDLFVCNRNIGRSITVSPGTEAKNSKGVMGKYTKIGNWKYEDLEMFSQFENRYRIANQNWLVKPVKSIKPSNHSKHFNLVIKNVKGMSSPRILGYGNELDADSKKDDIDLDDETMEFANIIKPNWETIKKLTGLEIHYNDAFRLLLIFACYDENDFDKAIKFVKDNCLVSSSADVQFDKSYDEIRSSSYFINGLDDEPRIMKIVNRLQK